MLLAQYTLAILLFWMALLQGLRDARPAPVGGPFYFSAPVGEQQQAWQPSHRLNYRDARRASRHCEIWFDARSLPVLERHMEGSRERWRRSLLWTRDGQLRRRVWAANGFVFREDELELRPLPRAW
jgi:hypothetical protein